MKNFRNSVSPLFQRCGTAVAMLALILAGGNWLGGCSGGNGISQENPELARLEQAMFNAINHYRDSIGLNRLGWDETSARQARLHSREMAADHVPLGHSGAEKRTANIGKKIKWVSISENVAYSTTRDDMIPFLLERWLASPGHRKNIEGEYNLTGMGGAVSPDGRYFFTQIFVLVRR